MLLDTAVIELSLNQVVGIASVQIVSLVGFVILTKTELARIKLSIKYLETELESQKKEQHKSSEKIAQSLEKMRDSQESMKDTLTRQLYDLNTKVTTVSSKLAP